MTKETREWVKEAREILVEFGDEEEFGIVLIHSQLDAAGQVVLFGDVIVTNMSPEALAAAAKMIQQPVPQSTQE